MKKSDLSPITGPFSDPVSDTLTMMTVRFPFFGSFFYTNMKVVETFDLPTAATDGDTIWVNPDFFKTLVLEERVFVMCHEIFHAILFHFHRGLFFKNSGFGPDNKKYSHRILNMAADYIINYVLKASNIGIMPKGGLWRSDITGDWSLEEAYIRVASEQRDQPGDGQGPGQGQQGADGEPHGGFDTHLEPDEPKDPNQVKTKVHAAMQVAKGMGNMPAGLETAINKFLEPVVSWEEELRRAYEPTDGREALTWAKPHRRRLALYDMHYPSATGYQTGGTLVQIDTSGSVSEEELAQFLGELSAIMSQCRPEWIKVLWIDTTCYEEEVEMPEDLEFIKPKGRGGTNMGKGLEYAANMSPRPATHIILTDGATPWGEPPDDDTLVIWGITEKQYTAPFGKTIHIDVGGAR